MRFSIPFAIAFFTLAGSFPLHAKDCPAPPAKDGIDFSLPCFTRPVNPIPDADRRVFFESLSAALSAESKATLDRQATILAKYPNITIAIIAFADDAEAPTTSERLILSTKRARAVGDYFAAKDLKVATIKMKGSADPLLIPRVRDEKTLTTMRQAQTLVE
ncbi:MAG: OmpA family protein [Rhodospirillales bacterium]|nr:OmpA family protein [Rhodospirillales bacterium]